jgi:uncharacterized membrane protein YfcA
MSILDFALIGMAAIAAGMVNALAGGGTLITFPALIATGVPAVVANVTNTVALCPGYLGATFAQSKDLTGQTQRMWLFLPAGALGGIAGGYLLLNTGERLFRSLVPVLILLASAILASQGIVKTWLAKRSNSTEVAGNSEKLAIAPVALGAVYGGYFGAGLSVIVLAVLGSILNDNLTRLNALKQAIAFSVNIAAAVLFVFSGKVLWSAALVMAVGALAGGSIGGRVAGKVNPTVLRWIVVIIGGIVGIIYLVRG